MKEIRNIRAKNEIENRKAIENIFLKTRNGFLKT